MQGELATKRVFQQYLPLRDIPISAKAPNQLRLSSCTPILQTL
jgi:hypothetical protein